MTDPRLQALDAETIAHRALLFLSEEPTRLKGLLAASGLAVGDVASLVGDRQFLAGLLAYLRSDESLLMVFCANTQIAPENVQAAQSALAGHPLE